eukprot:Hpha_TRINITY_DN37185_c0_g1::TRINITY_DN37185_c0_g1_i1::g.1590::m.1590
MRQLEKLSAERKKKMQFVRPPTRVIASWCLCWLGNLIAVQAILTPGSTDHIVLTLIVVVCALAQATSLALVTDPSRPFPQNCRSLIVRSNARLDQDTASTVSNPIAAPSRAGSITGMTAQAPAPAPAP